jgi:hypothetical protein
MGLHFPKYNIGSDKARAGFGFGENTPGEMRLMFSLSDAGENAQSLCGIVLRGVRTCRRYARSLVRILEVVKYIRKLVSFVWL